MKLLLIYVYQFISLIWPVKAQQEQSHNSLNIYAMMESGMKEGKTPGACGISLLSKKFPIACGCKCDWKDLAGGRGRVTGVGGSPSSFLSEVLKKAFHR